jgi:predicted small metal-binding protein
VGKVISCKDAGVNCDWTGKADSEEALIEKVKEHAKVDHGMPQLPPDMLAKARSIIRDE